MKIIETHTNKMGQTRSKNILPVVDKKNDTLTFTRYLYLKDEVELALVFSILNKSESSIFWAYELYHSGFKEDLWVLLWKIYFDFYYTLNPAFYQYFMKKYKLFCNLNDESIEKKKIIQIIVSDMLIRPYNLDVFLLRETVENFNIKTDTESVDLNHLLDNRNYIQIAKYILQECKEEVLDTINTSLTTYLISKYLNSKKIINSIKLNKDKLTFINYRVVVLANIMLYFSTIDSLQVGKNLYNIIDENDIKVYNTIFVNDKHINKPYKILPEACLFEIDEYSYLKLFKLKRHQIENIKSAYYYHWEYYASYSPIWDIRIKKYSGTINHSLQKIDFPNDELLEEFYENYGYEPDEQKKEMQDKNICIKNNDNVTWSTFYEKHKKNGLYVPDLNKLLQLEAVEY